MNPKSVTRTIVERQGKVLLGVNGGKTFKVVTNDRAQFFKALFENCDRYAECHTSEQFYKIVPKFSKTTSTRVMGVLPMSLMAVRPHIINVLSCARYMPRCEAFLSQNFYISSPYWFTLFIGKPLKSKTHVSILQPIINDEVTKVFKGDKDRPINYLCTMNALSCIVVYNRQKYPAIAVSRAYGNSYTEGPALSQALKHWAVKHGLCIVFLETDTQYDIMRGTPTVKVANCYTPQYIPQVLHGDLVPFRYADYDSYCRRNGKAVIEFIHDIKRSPVFIPASAKKIDYRGVYNSTKEIRQEYSWNDDSNVEECAECGIVMRTDYPGTYLDENSLNFWCDKCAKDLTLTTCRYCDSAIPACDHNKAVAVAYLAKPASILKKIEIETPVFVCDNIGCATECVQENYNKVFKSAALVRLCKGDATEVSTYPITRPQKAVAV